MQKDVFTCTACGTKTDYESLDYRLDEDSKLVCPVCKSVFIISALLTEPGTAPAEEAPAGEEMAPETPEEETPAGEEAAPAGGAPEATPGPAAEVAASAPEQITAKESVSEDMRTDKGRVAQADIRMIGMKWDIPKLVDIASNVTKVIVRDEGYKSETNEIHLDNGEVWMLDSDRKLTKVESAKESVEARVAKAMADAKSGKSLQDILGSLLSKPIKISSPRKLGMVGLREGSEDVDQIVSAGRDPEGNEATILYDGEHQEATVRFGHSYTWPNTSVLKVSDFVKGLYDALVDLVHGKEVPESLDERKYIDLTPTPAEYRHLLHLVVKNSSDSASRKWAKGELVRVQNVDSWKKKEAEEASPMAAGESKKVTEASSTALSYVSSVLATLEEEFAHCTVRRSKVDDFNDMLAYAIISRSGYRITTLQVMVEGGEARVVTMGGSHARYAPELLSYTFPVEEVAESAGLKEARKISKATLKNTAYGIEGSLDHIIDTESDQDDENILDQIKTIKELLPYNAGLKYYLDTFNEIAKERGLVVDSSAVAKAKAFLAEKKGDDECWTGDFATFSAKLFGACKDLDIVVDDYENIIRALQEKEAIELNKDEVTICLKKAKDVFVDFLKGQVKTAEQQSAAVGDLKEPPKVAPDLGSAPIEAPTAAESKKLAEEDDPSKDVVDKVEQVLKKFFA